MQYFLGVDGGQSSTIALIADESGLVIGAGKSGPCNHVSAADACAKFTRAIHECVGQALAGAGLDPNVHFEAACFGMSGGPSDKEGLLGRIVRTKLLLVTTDAHIALSGALGGDPGAVTIAGPGSISLARGSNGRIARAGGWGYVFGDEGGAFDIVRRAVRAALSQEEGWGPPTTLHPILLAAAEFESANKLLHGFYTPEWPRHRVAGLAAKVDEAARTGDAIAVEILVSAGRELTAYTIAAANQVREAGQTFAVSCVGGEFRSAILLEAFRTQLKTHSGLEFQPPRYSPAAGALLDAFQAVHRDVMPRAVRSSASEGNLRAASSLADLLSSKF